MEILTAIELLERMVIKGSIASPTDFNEAWRILKMHGSSVVMTAIGQEACKLTVIEGGLSVGQDPTD